MKKPRQSHEADYLYEDILHECEDLEFLNRFVDRLRETEYQILLIVCGHTKYGKVPIHMVKPILDKYWKTYKHIGHLKNITYVLNMALRKINTEKMYDKFKVLS